MPKYIRAQVTFVGTLWSDGTVHLTEMGSVRDGYLVKPKRYNLDYAVDGTCDPEELAILTAQAAQDAC